MAEEEPRTFGTTPGQPASPHDEAPVLDEHELEALGGDVAGSALEDLRELSEDVDANDIPEGEPLKVPMRPGYELVFRQSLELPVLNKLRAASKDKSSPDGIDALGLSARVLATMNVGILKKGERVLEAGRPLTVRSRGFLELMGVETPVEAILKLYGKGRDGDVISASNRALGDAGYGEEATGADPTLATR